MKRQDGEAAFVQWLYEALLRLSNRVFSLSLLRLKKLLLKKRYVCSRNLYKF